MRSNDVSVRSDSEVERVADFARQLRRDVIRMILHAGSGHPGGALGAADIFALLFSRMNHGPDRLSDPNRDRLVLSNGHICAAYYAALSRSGYFHTDELATFRRAGSRLQGHPARVHLPEIVETSTGPLGQGLSVANGIALSKRLVGAGGRVYCIVGDGEMQEGQVWEALLTSAQYRLDNITLVVSYNGIQIDGEVAGIKNIEPLSDKLRSFGWSCLDVDGHSIPALSSALDTLENESRGPVALVARTVMSKGVPFMENLAKWHGACPAKDEGMRALDAIGRSHNFEDFRIEDES